MILSAGPQVRGHTASEAVHRAPRPVRKAMRCCRHAHLWPQTSLLDKRGLAQDLRSTGLALIGSLATTSNSLAVQTASRIESLAHSELIIAYKLNIYHQQSPDPGGQRRLGAGYVRDALC